VVQSFEPDEEWGWDYTRERVLPLPDLAPPTSHPDDQPTPGPAGRVPDDWEDQVHT
jgi:hypothetical protein